MAIYEVNINERTEAGRSLVSYLYGLNVVEKRIKGKKCMGAKTGAEATLEAIREIDAGGGVHCKDFKSFFEEIEN